MAADAVSLCELTPESCGIGEWTLKARGEPCIIEYTYIWQGSAKNGCKMKCTLQNGCKMKKPAEEPKAKEKPEGLFPKQRER